MKAHQQISSHSLIFDMASSSSSSRCQSQNVLDTDFDTDFLPFWSSNLYRNSVNDSGITEDPFLVSSKVEYSLRFYTDVFKY